MGNYMTKLKTYCFKDEQNLKRKRSSLNDNDYSNSELEIDDYENSDDEDNRNQAENGIDESSNASVSLTQLNSIMNRIRNSENQSLYAHRHHQATSSLNNSNFESLVFTRNRLLNIRYNYPNI
jgi:hypothetical protein